MKKSTRRAIIGSGGLILFTVFFMVVDVNIFDIEWHHLFMLSIIVIITSLNFVYYIKEKRIEEIDESR